MSQQNPLQNLRLDKWLWAARFFKTRQLAVEAINGGKVHLNGQRTKPGKEVRPGSRLRIHKGELEWEIVVSQIPRQRRPASEAVHFYTESEQSLERRQRIVEERRSLNPLPHPHSGRPNKRDRRMIHRFTGR
jgi:ribosome-associated heat shock protein Hsp15